MTMATFASSRPGVFAGAEHGQRGFFARLIDALGVHRVYRTTLAELNALSIRQREDIGVAGLDMGDVARAATLRT